MKDSLISYLAAGLSGAALAAMVVRPEPLLPLLQVAALLSGPVLILVMFRTVKNGGSHEQRANDEREKRLSALHARLLRTVDEQRALGRAIDALEARGYLSRSSVIIEAERIAREAAKRHRPSSPHA